MELNLRTVLVVVAAIVMLGILIDGFRRMKRARQEALKLDVKQDFQFPEDGFSSELPNGGARVIGTREPEELKQEAQHFRDQLDDLPGMSALDEVEEKALHELGQDVQQSLHEERIYAGEPDFQHESYQHHDSEPLGVSESDTPIIEENAAILEDLNSAEDLKSVEDSSIVEPETLASELIEVQTNLTESEAEPVQEPVKDPVNEADNSHTEDFASEQLVPKAKPLNLDEQVPLLMDVEELGDELDVSSIHDTTESQPLESRLPEPQTSEPLAAEKEAIEIDQHIELDQEDIAGIQASVSDIAQFSAQASSVQAPSSEEDNQVIEEQVGVEEDGRQQAEDMMAQAAYAPVKKPGIHAESLDTRPEPSLVLVTHVIPHDEEGFCGEDILYLVNSCDLRHGEKDIFHRFEKENGEGRVQFSMANSFNPGTFNPKTLLHERIHGLSLFMSLPGPDKAMDAFEAMTEMASVIARNLGGDVHDETHSIMALQTIEHNRQQVRDFVRKQKLAQKK
jgi:cell division protein ZipA